MRERFIGSGADRVHRKVGVRMIGGHGIQVRNYLKVNLINNNKNKAQISFIISNLPLMPFYSHICLPPTTLNLTHL